MFKLSPFCNILLFFWSGLGLIVTDRIPVQTLCGHLMIRMYTHHSKLIFQNSAFWTHVNIIFFQFSVLRIHCTAYCIFPCLPHFHALPSFYFKNVLLGHVNEGSVKLFWFLLSSVFLSFFKLFTFWLMIFPGTWVFQQNFGTNHCKVKGILNFQN